MRFVVPVILPNVKDDLLIGNTIAGVAVSLIWVTYAVMQFPSGVILDRVGERFVFVMSMSLSAIGMLLYASAPGLAMFLIACTLFGLGTGLYGTPRVTIISEVYPKNDGIALGLTFAAGSIGAAALPVLAGTVSLHFGWRTNFAIMFPVFVLFALGMWYVLPEGVIARGNADGTSVKYATRRIKSALTQRSVLLSGGAITIVVFSFQGLTAFLPVYLISVKGLDQSTAGVLYGLFFATGAVVQPVAGYISDRYGDRTALILITGIYTLSLFALPFIDRLSFLAVLTVVLGSRAGIGPINNGYLVAVLPDDVRGSSYGLLRTTYMMIASTGSIAIGVLSDAGWFDEAFMLLAVLTAVATGCYLFLPARAES